MADTVESAVGIAEMKDQTHRETAELFLNELSEEEKNELVQAQTRGELKKLREQVTALNDGKIQLQVYLTELKNARAALKNNPASAPAPSEGATDEPAGPGDMVLPTLLANNDKLKDSFKQLAGIPFVGSFLLGLFFSKKALAGIGVKVDDVKLEGLLQGLDKTAQDRFSVKAREVITKNFGITEAKPELLLILTNLPVGEFLKRCPEKFDHAIWIKICEELKARKATETTSGTVMNFMVQYLKEHNGQWDQEQGLR